jgi:putative transport protein
MIEIVAQNPLVLLFSVIGIGYLAGNISIFGFRLGVAAVLFAGIAFGALDPRCALPEQIYIIGLVLFVYSIGLQSGPTFFGSFQRRGLRYSGITFLILCLAAALVGTAALLLRISAPSAAGLFCGSLTNTPALAAAVEATKNLSTGLAPAAREQLVNSPVVSYGLAYPFGVFGVILWIHLYRKLRRVTPEDAQREAAVERVTPITSVTFRVSNPAVMGRTVGQALASQDEPGFVLSRIRRGGRSSVVEGGTRLEAGDIVVAVGTPAAMERARLLFGEQVPEHLAEGVDGITYGRVFVSNKKIVGKPIRELQLGRRLQATITRLRRGDVEIVPSPRTILEMGDRIRVVSYRENMDAVTRFFGDSVRGIAETDFLSLSLGIVLGVFLGMVPIPLGGGLSFKLGFAGGPLIAGLVLGRLNRTGPIIWDLPYNANLVLRQVGLVFFLAAIGTRAGFGFVDTLRAGGWTIMAAGAAITTIMTLVVLTVGHRLLKLPMTAVLGMLSGIQTQPAVLAYANQQTESELPNTWYATVYPAAMVAKIILVQIIVSALLAR